MLETIAFKMNSGGQISNAGAGHLICMQCQEKKLVLKYIFPTQGGKKEFCSVPCLTAYRQDQKNRSGVGTNATNSNNNGRLLVRDIMPYFFY